MGWLRAHWKAVVIGTVLFLIGVGIGASGSETTSEGAGDAETITETTTVTEGSEAETVTETVTETVEAESQPGATKTSGPAPTEHRAVRAATGPGSRARPASWTTSSPTAM